MDRTIQLRNWLAGIFGHDSFALASASDDASFRRYFRVTVEGRPSMIAMDAPPDKEDCRTFVSVARLFAKAGVHVPEILAENPGEGFLLLSDLGDTTYLQALNETGADTLYGDALTALVRIQGATRPGVLPDYDDALLERELRLFPDWYVARQLRFELSGIQKEQLETGFSALLSGIRSQPRVYVHRDYHSRNLMVCAPNPGVLDFQDAVHGPITYDLASLLRDAYIGWEEERVIDWSIRYWEKARLANLPVQRDFADFYRDFEWMGAQRQLKVLGIFARLRFRDGKDRYLRDQPLVMRYLRGACARYRELGSLSRLLDDLEPHAATAGYTF